MDTKTCFDCDVEKPLSDFPLKNKKKSLYHCRCKVCYNEKSRREYSTKYRDAQLKRAKRNKQRNREFVYQILLVSSCLDCGESDPIVLEFHHRDPKDKVMCISHMAWQTYSQKKILEEIEKCDVLCSNCHKRRTAKENGWYSYISALLA